MIVTCVFFWIILAVAGISLFIDCVDNNRKNVCWWGLWTLGVLVNGLLTHFVSRLS